MENPFKFGTIVEDEYFTARVKEVAYIEQRWHEKKGTNVKITQK